FGPECSGLSFPARHGGANRSLDCNFDLRCKSKPDLHANNRHDRATLPGTIYLDAGVLQRIRAGVRAEGRRSGEVWPVIVGEMWALPAGGMSDPLRRLVPSRYH